ncbi:hypothetical protein KIN20_011885 [Parelaphostrongylus tenuis]|uniref:Uncharacterized protein n=1 Tax=Parelaphostrongylus tenuis TaxID=148309 RepID=A0AAD5MW31_PARTN|nr:hypothetical protein KIN20_011885 [Parelaphostrongylus tenuis]
MDVHARIASHLIGLFILLLLDTISTVLGCGVMPAGQARTRSFTVTGFTLPTAMVYSGNAAVAARFPGVASTPAGAQGFVQRLVMQTVLDVLEKQARNAFLPDAVISTILDQLTVNIAYKPLECKNAANPADRLKKENSPSCNIVGNTVTSICTVIQNEHQCEATRPNDVTVMPFIWSTFDNFWNSLDYKHHHGQLVGYDLAKCTESSGPYAGIGSICIALLHGIWHYQR